jgi:uncharacterized protein YjdB
MNNGANYKEHFSVPNASEYGHTGAGGDYWYGYNGVLFMSLNSNNRSTAEHRAFLGDAISGFKAQNGGVEPLWKIVTFHHSIYSSASHTTDTDIRQRREQLSPVIAEMGIDAVLAGHDHVYTRSLVMDGTTPITAGYTADGGNEYASYTKAAPSETVYLTANSASGSKYYAIKQVDFPFVAVENQENTPNITKVDVTEDSLAFTTYRTGSASTAADVVDEFTLHKETENILVESIDVSGGGSITSKGGTLQLSAVVSPDDAADLSVTWSISSGSCATVSESGLVRATGNGTVTVRATANDGSGVFGEATIAITGQAAVDSIGISGGGSITSKGGTLQLSAVVSPDDAADLSVTWSISSGSCATVSESGLVRATGNGAATVRATANDGSGVFGEATIVITGQTASCTVDFNANGGSVAPASSRTGEDGKLPSLPTPSHAGAYYFDGWYSQIGGGSQITTATVFLNDAVVYAHWIYIGGGGYSGSGSAPTATPTPPVAAPTPSRTIILSIGSRNYMVNNESRLMDVAPFIWDDYTMVPLRFIAEALGAQVGWDDASRTVTIIYEGRELKLVIGQNVTDMPIAPLIRNDRTFVPTRYIMEYFGATVDWDEASKTVTVKKY